MLDQNSVGNKAKGRISKQMFQENNVRIRETFHDFIFPIEDHYALCITGSRTNTNSNEIFQG